MEKNPPALANQLNKFVGLILGQYLAYNFSKDVFTEKYLQSKSYTLSGLSFQVWFPDLFWECFTFLYSIKVHTSALETYLKISSSQRRDTSVA